LVQLGKKIKKDTKPKGGKGREGRRYGGDKNEQEGKIPFQKGGKSHLSRILGNRGGKKKKGTQPIRCWRERHNRQKPQKKSSDKYEGRGKICVDLEGGEREKDLDKNYQKTKTHGQQGVTGKTGKKRFEDPARSIRGGGRGQIHTGEEEW